LKDGGLMQKTSKSARKTKTLPTTVWGPASRLVDATPNTRSAEAYERIRADVVAGRLSPGEKLLNDAMKREYGIGGSPMREAFMRLAADGLLYNEGQKGFRVVSATAAELVDVGKVRLDLELKALSEAIREGGVDWEVSVVSQFQRLQHALTSFSKDPAGYADQWETTHRAFHFSLLQGCNSPWLMHFCDRIYDQTERYRRLYTRYENIPPPLISGHKEIMEAALARDVAKSSMLLGRHIVGAIRQTLKDMMARGAPSDPAADAAIVRLSDQWTPSKTKSRARA
jgi:GntR family carbon starvation induced transcriptional regulator